MNRKSIPEKVKKLIFQESNSTCPFCGERDINTLEIHHIDEYSQSKNNDPKNLILVCSNCHAKITNGAISKAEVIKKKLKLTGKILELNPNNRSQNNVNVSNTVNTGIIANKVTINTQSKKLPKLEYPEGSIGRNLIKRNYIKYLIDRYNEYKKADKNLGNFKYSIIYNAIKKEFKSKWDYIPESRFEELVLYLQNRIDRTIVGRIQKSKNHENYESFEEYVERNA